MSKSKFIVFEGVDGSGKSTQAEMLANALGKNHQIMLTREPSDGIIGKFIRDDIISNICFDDILDMSILHHLFTADRYQHVKCIKESLDDEFNVICDRYVLSAMAYDNICEEMNDDAIMAAIQTTLDHNYDIYAYLKPDLTIYINTPLDEIVKRILDRDGELTRFESKDLLKKREDCYYHAINEIQDENIVSVDGSGTKEEVHERVLDVIGETFPDLVLSE